MSKVEEMNGDSNRFDALVTLTKYLWVVNVAVALLIVIGSSKIETNWMQFDERSKLTPPCDLL